MTSRELIEQGVRSEDVLARVAARLARHTLAWACDYRDRGDRRSMQQCALEAAGHLRALRKEMVRLKDQNTPAISA